MAQKKFRIQTICPSCGCSSLNALSDEEIRERYGDLPNLDMECSECLLKYAADIKTACPEWDKECQLKEESDQTVKKLQEDA